MTVFLVNNSPDIPAKEVIFDLTESSSKSGQAVSGMDVDFNCSNKNMRLSEYYIANYSEVIVVYNFKKISKLHYSVVERSN
jgi:hypothetical protein